MRASCPNSALSSSQPRTFACSLLTLLNSALATSYSATISLPVRLCASAVLCDSASGHTWWMSCLMTSSTLSMTLSTGPVCCLLRSLRRHCTCIITLPFDRPVDVIPSFLTNVGHVVALTTSVRKAMPPVKKRTRVATSSESFPPARSFFTVMASARPTAPRSPPHVMITASCHVTGCLSGLSHFSTGSEANRTPPRMITATR
mmetsp:Transcript_81084/g.208736  ORF Transcript_81084/g.208736 Transcript_81084/m.208736 type:complete len:203 (+) Transcript_81084:1719-2327(+)